jgi:hypothetical protein
VNGCRATDRVQGPGLSPGHGALSGPRHAPVTLTPL